MGLTLPVGAAALPLVAPNKKARQTSGPGDGDLNIPLLAATCSVAVTHRAFVTGLDRSIK